MSILKINCSARFQASTSRKLTQYLADLLGGKVIERDLGKFTMPAFSSEDLMDMHHSRNIRRESLIHHQSLSTQFIQELEEVDTLIIGMPIYNFSIPAVLKRWIDYVVRNGITFRYGKNGPEGLCNIKTAYIICSSGGTTIGGPADFASSYLEHILNFIGINNVQHIPASGSQGPKEKVIESAQMKINQLLNTAETDNLIS